MVINKKYNTDYASTWEFFGESSETKPTVANGAEEIAPDNSMWVELDTGEVYYYSKANDNWSVFGG